MLPRGKRSFSSNLTGAMVDLAGAGPDGPIEHGFNNSVFILPAVVVVGLMGELSGW